MNFPTKDLRNVAFVILIIVLIIGIRETRISIGDQEHIFANEKIRIYIAYCMEDESPSECVFSHPSVIEEEKNLERIKLLYWMEIIGLISTLAIIIILKIRKKIERKKEGNLEEKWLSSKTKAIIAFIIIFLFFQSSLTALSKDISDQRIEILETDYRISQNCRYDLDSLDCIEQQIILETQEEELESLELRELILIITFLLFLTTSLIAFTIASVSRRKEVASNE